MTVNVLGAVFTLVNGNDTCFHEAQHALRNMMFDVDIGITNTEN